MRVFGRNFGRNFKRKRIWEGLKFEHIPTIKLEVYDRSIPIPFEVS